MKKSFIVIGIIIVIFISIGTVSIYSLQQEKKVDGETQSFVLEEDKENASLPITVEPVIDGDFPVTVIARGEIAPGEERTLRVPFSTQVKEVHVRSGDIVQKGQLIFTLDSASLQIEQEKARDDLLIAQAKLAEKLRNYSNLSNKDSDNIKQLRLALKSIEEKYKSGEISFEEYTLQHTSKSIEVINEGGHIRDIKEIETGVRSAISRVAELEMTLAKARVISPVKGKIVFEKIFSGTDVVSGNILATVYHFDKSLAILTVLERDIHRIVIGQEVGISVGIKRVLEIKGQITYISPIKDKISGGYTVFAAFLPGEKTVYQGMFAEGEIIVETLPDRIIIPRKAVLREGERYYVFIVKDDLAWWRWVDIEQKNGMFLTVVPSPFEGSEGVERIKGIDPGELIAVEGHNLLTHKAAVTIEISETL